jgi:hypothetical protein
MKEKYRVFSKRTVYLLTGFAFLWFFLIGLKIRQINNSGLIACNFKEQKIVKIEGNTLNASDIIWQVLLDNGQSIQLVNLAEIGQTVLIATECHVDKNITKNEADLKNDEFKKVIFENGQYHEVEHRLKSRYVLR